MIQRWPVLILGLVIGGAASGCGAGAPPPSAATRTPTSAQSGSHAPSASEAASPVTSLMAGVAPAAVPADARAGQASAEEQSMASPTAVKERPGLATQFGEDLQREVRRSRFERDSFVSPFVTTTIWYNDASGAETMAQGCSSRVGDRAEVELLNGGLVVGITNERFQLLPGFVADGRAYAIGEANARYAIRIANRSDFAFEVVASVDGLNVIDGRPASVERRGYIVAPRDALTIEGFRTGDSTVAAFRFGKVSEAYSVQSGQGDRNVGVIGVAFFQERGVNPVYPSEDTRLRRDANPFPGEYAPRPPGR